MANNKIRPFFWLVIIGFVLFSSACAEKEKFLPYTEALPAPSFSLYDYGKEEIVDYEKYGKFEGVGTADYKYEVSDQEGLAAATGEGIYPNSTSFRWDPKYVEYKKEGLLKGNHWDFVHGRDLLANFYKWCSAPEPPGVRQFYIATILEEAGLIKHAIKAYYSIVIHFPYANGWTYWHTPWYIGPASLHRIKYLTRRYPELKMKLVDAKIIIENGEDNNILNDKVKVWPGRIIKVEDENELLPHKRVHSQDAPILEKGGKNTKLVKYKDNSWALLVDGKPYIIKGMTYAPTKIGQSPDDGTMKNWMFYDYNKNGLIDGPYDAWVDWNRNGKQDKDEPAVGDLSLFKAMGLNTLRIYRLPEEKLNKPLLKDMYERFGIRIVMSDFLGMYTIGSGASWDEGTDYSNKKQQENMKRHVREMVEEFKDEPYILFWLLGNENNYGVANNAKEKPDAYYKFVNEVAKMIKEIDPTRPVAICNGDVLFLDKLAKYCPDIDIVGMNAYRGDAGFGDIWLKVSVLCPDKAAMITEYGCPAYGKGLNEDEAEKGQAMYYLGCWEDILYNSGFYDWGVGNSIGGFAFEWTDEWWKAYKPFIHNTESRWAGPFLDGFMYEEWLGITGQGSPGKSPFLRVVRKSYEYLRKAWLSD